MVVDSQFPVTRRRTTGGNPIFILGVVSLFRVWDGWGGQNRDGRWAGGRETEVGVTGRKSKTRFVNDKGSEPYWK